MRGLIAIVLLMWSVAGNPITKISNVNTLKDKAAKAFELANYSEAASIYKLLVDSLKLDDENLKLNYGHASYLSGDTATARGVYQTLSGQALDAEISSIAYHQLGIMAGEQKMEESLQNFKWALRKNPANERARYNYELLKKKQRNEQEQSDQEDIEPSEFAKQMKKKAESLVSEKKYAAAFNVMMEALEKDLTVRAFGSFLNRLKNVVEVNPE